MRDSRDRRSSTWRVGPCRSCEMRRECVLAVKSDVEERWDSTGHHKSAVGGTWELYLVLD